MLKKVYKIAPIHFGVKMVKKTTKQETLKGILIYLIIVFIGVLSFFVSIDFRN